MLLNWDVIGSVNEVEKGNGKALIVIMVGAPGSGKSTFCDLVIGASSRCWIRICQVSLSFSPSCLLNNRLVELISLHVLEARVTRSHGSNLNHLSF